MQMDKEKRYSYTYSAKQQAEVKRIRDKYTEQGEDKMQRLIRLDASATKKGTAISLILGTAGALIMGAGMSCIMIWSSELFIPGIVTGVIGMGLICSAYPVYSAVTKKERKRIAPEILKLTEELLK